MINTLIAGLTDGATYGLLALGIVLVYKATGVINFASGELGTLSIYIAWVISAGFGEHLGEFGPLPVLGLGLPIIIASVLAVASAAGLGAAMEKLVVRPMAGSPPLTITVATLGVSTILGGMQFIIFGESPQNLPALVPGVGVQVGSVFVAPGRILAFIVTLAFAAVLYWFFNRTTFGLGVLAASQNPVALRLQGVPLRKVAMFTWAMASVLAACAAIIIAPTIGAFHPFFMTLLLIPSFAAALVGGLNSLPGALVGGLVVGVTNAVSRYLWGDALPGVEFVAQFVLIVGVLVVRPRGLLGAAA